MNGFREGVFGLVVAGLLASASGCASLSRDRSGFVSVEDVVPGVLVEARYHGGHNFIGERVDGYRAPKCLLAKPAATALAAAQKELNERGYTIKVYDCYRPQTAVNHFVRWAKDLKDTRMKGEFYPEVDKTRLFSDGYIASRSGHSRGGTLDLTIVKLPARSQPAFRAEDPLVPCFSPKRFPDNSVDMGTGYDCFDPRSHTENPAVGKKAIQNRRLLKSVMEKHGFRNYDKEWWHYTLVAEPYPDTYFDFPVE